MRPFARLAVGVTLGLALVACGSTVPVSQQAVSGGSADGLGTTPSDSGATNDGTTDQSLGGAGSTGSLQGGTGTSGGGSTTGLGSVDQGTVGGVDTGVSGALKPILVGITYVKDAAAGFQAIGIQGATLGDMHLYAQVLVDDANKHGGLGGRKIVPIYFAYDVNPGTPSYDQQDSEACAQFTQDHHVEVAIVTFAGLVLNECMKKNNIPMLLDGPGGGFSESILKRYSQMFCLGCFNLDRRADQQVPALVREKYFSPWDNTNGGPGVAPVKIGIITYDFPGYPESVNGPLVHGIVAAGYPKPQVITVAAHDTYDNLSRMQSQLASAVLSFRTNGVTHVIVWDDNGVATLFFMQQAESQQYRPRYGINSGNNMQTVAKVASKNQLKGAIGIGWDPSFDIAEAKDDHTGKWANSARRACYALMVKNKAAPGTGFNETSAMLYCSTIWALKDRWEFMSHPTAAGLPAALAAYGAGFVDPMVPTTWLSPTQHDGNSGIYDYVYDTGCSCMKYASGVHLLARD